MPKFTKLPYLTETFIDQSQEDVVENMAGLLPKGDGVEVSDKAFRDGVCAAMSALWIERRNAGNAYWPTLDDKHTIGSLHALQRSSTESRRILAMAFGGMGHAGDIDAMHVSLSSGLAEMAPQMFKPAQMEAVALAKKKRDAALGPHIADKTGLQLTHQPATQAAVQSIGEALTNSPHGFQWIAFQYTGRGGSGGHAVAVHMSPNRVTFMDPNHGEVDFASPAEFSHWLDTNHLNDWYGTITEYQIDHFARSAELDRAKEGAVLSSDPNRNPFGAKGENDTLEARIAQRERLAALPPQPFKPKRPGRNAVKIGREDLAGLAGPPQPTAVNLPVPVVGNPLPVVNKRARRKERIIPGNLDEALRAQQEQEDAGDGPGTT